MKKMLSLLSAILLAATLFSGCGRKVLQEVEQTNQSLKIYAFGQEDFTRLNVARGFYHLQYPDVELEIVFKDDAEDEQYYQELERAAAEIMAGKGPDLFICPYAWDVEKMMHNQLFADMEPYFVADNFDWSPYPTAVMDAGVWEGKRYMVPMEYSIPVLLSTEEVLDEAGFQPENCKDFYGFMAETQKLLDDPDKTRAVFRQSWRLQHFPNYAGVVYADYESEKVDLSWEGWEDAFAWCQKVYQEDRNDFEFTPPKAAAAFRDGEFVFEEMPIGASYWFDTCRLLKTLGTPVYLPIRNVNGGITAEIDNSVAVRANSANLQNAYNFIKILLGQDYQSQTFKRSWRIPVYTPVLDSLEKEWQGSCRWVCESYGFDHTAAEITDEDTEAYLAFIEEIDSASWWPTELARGMRPYLQGKVSYEEGIKDAVKQVERYLSE